MKPRNFTILILIAIIAGLLLIIPIKENQHNKTIAEYLNREARKEEARLEVYNEFVKNYNELYNQYNELYTDYQRLYKNLTVDGWQEFGVTGYSANDCEQGTNNIVATNFNLNYENVKNIPIIAVDPDVIPLYSIVEIEGMGAYVSLDTGGAIKGNRIDILFDSKEEALNFGKQELLVRVIK